MKRLLVFLFVGATIGILAFLIVARRATDFETVLPEVADLRFEDARERAARDIADVLSEGTLPSGNPGTDGPAAPGAVKPRRIGILLYDAERERLIHAEIPFWFFRMKGDILQLTLGGSALDLEANRATPAELESHGPGIFLDQMEPDGDRALIWLW